MIGYWFSKEDGTTTHLFAPAKIGKTDTYNGTPIPCQHGLHFSPTPWDALQYASGPILWEVESPDDAIPHGDPVNKYAGNWRTYLRRADLTRAMRIFSAKQALYVIHLWDAPAIVGKYLRDEAQGKDRTDIRDAAWAAASAAAWDAASADSAAAWAAVRDPARDAARDAARQSFNKLAMGALGESEQI